MNSRLHFARKGFWVTKYGKDFVTDVPPSEYGGTSITKIKEN